MSEQATKAPGGAEPRVVVVHVRYSAMLSVHGFLARREAGAPGRCRGEAP